MFFDDLPVNNGNFPWPCNQMVMGIPWGQNHTPQLVGICFEKIGHWFTPIFSGLGRVVDFVRWVKDATLGPQKKPGS